MFRHLCVLSRPLWHRYVLTEYSQHAAKPRRPARKERSSSPRDGEIWQLNPRIAAARTANWLLIMLCYYLLFHIGLSGVSPLVFSNPSCALRYATSTGRDDSDPGAAEIDAFETARRSHPGPDTQSHCLWKKIFNGGVIEKHIELCGVSPLVSPRSPGSCI